MWLALDNAGCARQLEGLCVTEKDIIVCPIKQSAVTSFCPKTRCDLVQLQTRRYIERTGFDITC